MLLLIFLCFLTQISAVNVYPPTWLTSPSVQSDSFQIISVLTSSSSTPTYTFNFISSFSNIPFLGYGIKEYKGTDYLIQEHFQVNRTSLTNSSFSVLVQIQGFTNINKLSVSYIAIDSTFPHHLNSFDNVPINYNAGSLVNVTTQSSSTQYYSNTINYTSQVGLTSSHNTFLTPYTRNKILLFLTSLFVDGSGEADPANGPLNPVQFTVQAQIVSSDSYKLSLSLRVLATISRLHFSIIVFDQKDVQSSGGYMLVYQRVSISKSGGFIQIPYSFRTNFIIGLVDFSSIRTKSSIHFQWNFQIVNGTEGVTMPLSAGLSPLTYVVDNLRFQILYMKKWSCPTATIFDPNLDLCVENTINPQNNQQMKQTIKISEYLCNGFVIQIPKANYSSNISFYQSFFKVSETKQSSDFFLVYVSSTRKYMEKYLKFNMNGQDYFLNFKPIIPFVLYTNFQCQKSSNYSTLVKILTVFSYVVMIISLITFKIVGLQLFGLLQVAFFTLSDHNYFDLYLSNLVSFKIFNGFNLSQLMSGNSLIPIQIEALSISSQFLNNINIMLLLIVLFIITGAILNSIGKRTQNQTVKSISSLLLRQGLITLVLFNIYNYSFSAGMQWKYGNNQQFGWANQITIFCFLIGLIAALYAMENCPNIRLYGEFKTKFKDNFLCRSYILFSVIQRFSLGLFMSLKNDYQFGSFFALPISFIFFIYFILNFPFKSTLQNYRSCFCHILQLVILLATNYYRGMKSTTPLQIKAYYHVFAEIQIVLIAVFVFISFLVLCYEIIIYLKHIKRRRSLIEKKIQQQNNKNQLHENNQTHENTIEAIHLETHQ